MVGQLGSSLILGNMYLLQAFISKDEKSDSLKMDIPFVSLEQGFLIFPVNKVVREKLNIPISPLIEGNDNGISIISSFGCSVSNKIKVAYVEAEFFGGRGMQASVIFENEKIVSEPKLSINAINLALQYLGVSKLNFFDEFDALGLGKYRDTEKWTNNV